MHSVSHNQWRHQRICLMLLLGAGLSLLLYLTARSNPDQLLTDQLLEDKASLHHLKSWGGTAAVLAARFSCWFDGLWQGQAMAGTIAAICTVMVLQYFILGDPATAGTPDHEGDHP